MSAMANNIDIVGIDRLEKDLRKLQSKMTKRELVKLIRPGANIILREIKAQTPQQTGTLKRAIRLRVGRGASDAPYASILTNFRKNYLSRKTEKRVYPFYVKFVHFGTVTSSNKRKHRKGASVGKTRIHANPFIYRAFKAKYNEAARVILDKISKSVEQ